MKKTITIFLVFIFHLISYPQIPEIIWQQCYGTDESDDVQCLEKAENGYIIGIGISSGGTGITNYHGGGDAWIIKIDTFGNVVWEKCYGGSQGELPHKIIKIPGQDIYYLFCSTNSMDGDVTCGYNYGSSDFWVVKIDGNGNIIWDHCYGSPSTDYPRDAIVTPDGGLLFMGRVVSAGADVSVYYGANDTWICKIDSLGTLEWEKTVANSNVDNGLKIKMISDTTFAFVGGYYESGGMIDCQIAVTGDGADLWLVEMSLENGDIIKQYCYGGSHNDLGYDFEKLEDGYIITGCTTSNDGDVSGLHGPGGEPDISDIWALRIDGQGSIIWQKCLGGFNSETPYFVTQVKDSGFVVVGNTASNDGDVTGNHSFEGGAWRDIWVVKLTQDGVFEWNKCYGGQSNERFWGRNAIVKNNDYNYVFAAQAFYGPSYDVDCSISGNIDAWVFEIKNCSNQMPIIPETPAGKDTVCTVGGQYDNYSIPPATWAWYYEWMIEPQEAGTISGDSLSATVSWAEAYEGTTAIIVRGINDCGEGMWSAPKYIKAEACTGIEEFIDDNFKIKVYPNPAKDFVIFDVQSSKFESSVITIMDVYGNEVDRLKVTNEKTVWQTKDIDSGLYFYRIEIEGKQVSGKVMVVK